MVISPWNPNIYITTDNQDLFLNKDTPFIKTLIFSAKHTFLAGKNHCVAMVLSQIITALITPLSVLIIGKMATLFTEVMDAPSPDLSTLLPWMIFAIIISILLAISRIVTQYSSACLQDRLNLRMRHLVTEHITSLNLELIEDRNVQNVLERAQDDPGMSLLNFFTGVLGVCTAFIRIAGLVGVIFWIAPVWAGIIALLCIPVLAGHRFLSRIDFNLKRNKTVARRWSSYYSDVLTNRETIPTTVTLGLISLFLRRFKEKILEINLANQRFYRLQALLEFGITVLMIGVLIGVLFTVTKDVLSGSLSVGKFTAFWLAGWRLQVAMTGLGKSFYRISKAELNIFNIRELFTIRNNLPPDGVRQPQSSMGKLELKNLSFTYGGTDCPVLHNISLTIQRGETVAIVGPNGSGKTTLAKLLAQLYMPTQGEILIDDLPACEYSRKAIYDAISFVTQNPIQFEGTAHENIAFGDWGVLLDAPDTVHDIAEKTQVDQLIRRMPEGYRTQLGRLFGQYDISGGQRQKLAVARALACDPAILILDEPTASLDIQTEYELFTNIRNLVHDKTTILISHRFSTVQMADRIYVLNEGELIESGSHDELISNNGTYSVMFNMYAKMGGT